MSVEKTINPEFKKQLLLLKNRAETELNIQISIQKMVSDTLYRNTVLTELNGLGSDTLNELVSVLKHTPVYIKQSKKEAEPAARVKETTQKSPLLSILIALVLVVLIAVFVSWQNGYLNISITSSQNTASDALSPSLTVATISATTTSSAALVTTMKPLTLPSTEPVVKLRLHGSNTVGEELAPALLEAYLRSLSVTQMQWLQGDVAVERELQYIQHGKVHAIQLYAHGSSTGFEGLLAGTADMSMSSRKIRTSEVEALKATKGDLSKSGQEYIIGLDGLAIIVHKSNLIEHISSDKLAQIFSGEINNWQQLGGADLAINLYARDKNSGTWDTFNSLVLKVHNKQLSQNSLRYESSSELSNKVSEDTAAIGFIGLPYINNSKAVAISETEQSIATYPTGFTVSTEDYALSRRLYMYAPSSGNPMAQAFSRFAISDVGQSVVEQVGLVSQNIKLEGAYQVKNAPQNYNKYAEIANRLSVSFRFESGSNELDNKAKRDIKRLVDYLTKHRGRRVVLMGFSDSLGDPNMNIKLSFVRASQLEKELNAYGLNVTAVEGFGAYLPIGSNSTSMGRSKNRRVEVWVF